MKGYLYVCVSGGGLSLVIVKIVLFYQIQISNTKSLFSSIDINLIMSESRFTVIIYNSTIAYRSVKQNEVCGSNCPLD